MSKTLALSIVVAALLLILATRTLFGQLAMPDITGGNPAQQGDLPSMVFIRSPAGLCSGVLIHPEWVASAGHCGDNDISASWYSMDIGGISSSYAIEEGEVRVSAIKKVVHHEFNPETGENELTLFKIPQQLQTSQISSVGIYTDIAPSLGIQWPVIISATIAGWGYTEDGATKELNYANVEYICHRNSGSDLVCRSPYTPEIGGCYGDSGGAMYVNHTDGTKELFGIIWGGNSCTEEVRVTRVTSFTEKQIAWVMSEINKPPVLTYLPRVQNEPPPQKLYVPAAYK